MRKSIASNANPQEAHFGDARATPNAKGYVPLIRSPLSVVP